MGFFAIVGFKKKTRKKKSSPTPAKQVGGGVLENFPPPGKFIWYPENPKGQAFTSPLSKKKNFQTKKNQNKFGENFISWTI